MAVEVSDVQKLRGKRVAFITSGYSGKRFIYEKAKQLEVISTIIDSPQSWSKSLVEEGIIDSFIGVDFGRGAEKVVSDILNYIRAASLQLDGVCTFAELSLPVAAKLAESLNLPGNSPEVVSLTRDKHKVRKIVAGAGLNEIKSFHVKSVSDLDAAAEYVGFPAVLKPISGADSLGVTRVDNKEELSVAQKQVQDIVAGLVVTSGALSRTRTPTSIDTLDESAHRFIKLDLSLEEYLDGPEVDVDLVMHAGDCFFAAVVDNGPTKEPYFAETWNLCPSILTESKQVELIDEAIATIKALGFHSGVFHVEEKYTSRGPRIIEVNARMGGGPIRLQHKYVYGVDLVVEQLLSCVGLAPSVRTSIPAAPLEPNRCYASSTPNAPRSGTIKSSGFLDSIRNRPDLLALWDYIECGAQVIGPADGHPSWICEIALVGKNGSEALLKELMSVVDDLISDVDSNYYC